MEPQPPLNQTPVNPLTQSPTSHKKTIIILIVIAILLIVSFSSLAYIYGASKNNVAITPPLISQQPSEVPIQNTSNIDTSAWQTYTNPQYGYSFKYPPMINSKIVNLEENRPGYGEGVWLTEEYDRNNPEPLIQEISLSVRNNPQKLSAKEWNDEFFNEKVIMNNKETTYAQEPLVMSQIVRTPITVNGQLGERIEGIPGRFAVIEIYVPYQDKMYEFTQGPNDLTTQEDLEREKVLLAILSTFQFPK